MTKIMINKSKNQNKYSKDCYCDKRSCEHIYSPPRGHMNIASVTRKHINMVTNILKIPGNFIKNSLANPATMISLTISIIVFASKSLLFSVNMGFISIKRIAYARILVKEECYA